MLLLSTVQPLRGVTRDDGKRKPGIYKLYDFTKGGTDVIEREWEATPAKPNPKNRLS